MEKINILNFVEIDWMREYQKGGELSMDELQRNLHGFRKDIDAVTQNVKTLRDNPVAMVCAREIALSITKLEEAKMWLNKALGETGSEMPADLADKATPASTPAQPEQPAPQAPVAPVNTTPEQAGVVPQGQNPEGQPQQ